MKERAIKSNDERSFLMDLDGVRQRYALGMRTIRKVADECGATVHIGSRCVRYNVKVLDEYFEKLTGKGV